MLSFWETQSFIRYDYIVVGSGIVGLSAAATILEKQPQAQVLVLEKGIFPTGASTKNAGFACFGSPSEILSDIQKVGEEKAIALIKRRLAGLTKLRARLGDQAIGYEETGSYEMIIESDFIDNQQISYLNELLKPIFAGKLAFPHYQRNDLEKMGFNPQKIQGGLIFCPFEGQINTGQMMRSLIEYVQKKGAMILNNCEVNAIEADSAKVKVLVNQQVEFTAAKVIVCTNAFTGSLYPQLPIAPGRGQVLVTKPLKNLKFKGNFHLDRGYYYFRNFENRVIFGGGRNLDFQGETTTELITTDLIMNDLQEKLRDIILYQQDYEIEQTWAGVMAFTPNHLPIVGLQNPRVALGVALNGMGVAIGSLVGEEAVSLVNNE
jgi:glycine/D-amino acid oxidase-like deaminating enzyme